MSLRQLAGPFHLTDDQGTALVPHTVNPICYYPGFGLVMKINVSAGIDALWLVAVDGIAQPLTTQDMGSAGGFDPARWRYDMVTSQLITNSGLARDKICLCLVPYTVRVSNGPGGFEAMGVYVADRAVYCGTSGFGVGVYSSLGLEASLPSISVSNVQPGRTVTEVYIGKLQGTGSTDNRGVFYDTATKKFTTQVFHLGDGIVASYWDVDSGVLVTITDTPQYTFNIFSLDVIPISISAVTLQSGVVAKGATATFQAQVLGDKGDWSVGVLVDWTITSGDGVLLDSQSTTKADGFAPCRVFYPTDASVNTVLHASVTC